MKLPPTPQTPKLLQMLEWIVRPMAYMEDCTQLYGDIFTLHLGEKFAPVVFVSSPQANEQILAGDSKDFDAPGESNMIFQPFVGDHSVITLSGTRHRRQRNLLMPPFHGERMRAYGQIISDVTEQVVSEWKIGQPFNVRASTQSIAMRVILRAVFGLNEGERTQKIEQLFTELLDKTSSPLSVTMLYFPALRKDLGSWSPWGRFVRLRQQVDKLIYQEIQERREQPDEYRTDILSLLMAARDEAGQPMTDVELRDELMTLLLAGHETTATALAWALYWIHKLPAVREKLLEELDSLGDDLDPGVIFRLPYLNAVCSEALRIYPVAMLTFPRVVRVQRSLCGYELEPGTPVIGSIYLTHRRQDLYPEPEQFKPERFLERQFSAYEYLPFGGGSRRCIGLAFAQFEMKVVLAKMLLRWQITLEDNRVVRPVRRGLVTAPGGGVRIVVTGQRPQNVRKLQTSSSSV